MNKKLCALETFIDMYYLTTYIYKTPLLYFHNRKELNHYFISLNKFKKTINFNFRIFKFRLIYFILRPLNLWNIWLLTFFNLILDNLIVFGFRYLHSSGSCAPRLLSLNAPPLWFKDIIFQLFRTKHRHTKTKSIFSKPNNYDRHSATINISITSFVLAVAF
jgi:hypothetical protein